MDTNPKLEPPDDLPNDAGIFTKLLFRGCGLWCLAILIILFGLYAACALMHSNVKFITVL